MATKATLIGVVLAALVAAGFLLFEWSGGANAFAGRDRIQQTTQTQATLITNTPPLPPTAPPPRASATPWLDAPHNSYIQPVLKQEATATATQVSGTYTPPAPPTDPPPPDLDTATPTPVDSAYAPFVIDTASTATLTPTATATIDPDATPTIWLTHTPPPPVAEP